MSAISLGPNRVGVTWSKPINPFGPINDYRIFYSASKIVRREAANNEKSIIVSASEKKEANLTELKPYTNYRIAIAAVNIRDGDNKILLGTRSNEVYVQTDEDGIEKTFILTCYDTLSLLCSAPSAPRDLISSPLTITSVNIKWSPPEHPNGKIRSYTLAYAKASGATGDKTIITINGTDSLSVILKDLETAVNYSVSVRV